MQKDTKILEVLVEVVTHLLDYSGKSIEEIEKEIVERLVDKGYGLEEINELLDEVFRLMNLSSEEEVPNIRVVLPEEFNNFNEEAKEYLIYLKNSMIISEIEFEEALNDLSANYHMNGVEDVVHYLKSRGISTNITIS